MFIQNIMEKKRREGVVYPQRTSEEINFCQKKKQINVSQIFQTHKNKNNIETSFSTSIYKPNTIMPLPQIRKKKSGKSSEEDPQNEPGVSTFFFSFIQRFANIVLSKYISIIVLIFLLSACFAQGFERNTNAMSFGQILQKVCFGIFTLLFLSNLINCKKEQIGWLILDFITISAGITSFLVEEEEEALRYLKAIRALKLLFLFKFVDFLNESMSQLMNALKRVGKILIPVLIFIYLFAIVGLYAFYGMEYRKCRHPDNKKRKKDWTVYEDQVFLCGNRACPIIDGVQYECLNPVDYNVEPNPKELINLTQGNGLLQYSNIGYAVFSTFKELFVTGSSRLIVLYKQTTSQLAVSLYYYAFILLIPYIYMNIFYGLLIAAANQYHEEHEEKNTIENSLSERQQTQNQDERRISVQTVSIQSHNEITRFYFERTEKGIEMKKNSERLQRQHENVFQNFSLELNENNSGLEVAKEPSSRRKEASKNFFFNLRNYISPIMVILAVLNLSLDYEGQSKQFQFTTDCIYFFFLTVQYLEIIIKSTQEFRQTKKLSQATKIDLFIGIICTIGVIYELIEAQNLIQFLECEKPQFEIFRSFMYLRIFVVIMDSEILEDFNRNIYCISHGVWAIRYFILTWVFVLLILTIMGYHLHHGKTFLDENGKLDLKHGNPEQVSFETMYKAFLFTILTVYDEQWDILMFKEYLGCGALIIIWQFITLIVGFLLLSKYLMCYLSQQIDRLLEKNDNQNVEEEQLDDLLVNEEVSVNKISHSQTVQHENEVEESCRVICMRKVQDILKKILASRPYAYIMIAMNIFVLLNISNKTPSMSIDSEYFLINLKSDSISIVFLLIDLIINLLAYGLCSDSQSYLHRSYFSKINLFLIVIEILQLCSFYKYIWFRRLERIRFLRIFALIQARYRSNWNMRIMIRSLKRLVFKILQIIIFSLLVYYFFALVLTKCFKNDYYYCDNAHQRENILTKDDCLDWGGDWMKNKLNFGNPLNSLLYLFLIATTEGWITQMQQAMNLNGEGNAPLKNANAGIQVFFILFFFFGNLIILNSVISISLFNYKKIKEKETGENMITENEKIWLELKLKILELNPIYKQIEPNNCIRKYLYRICNHNIYNGLKIFLFVLLIAGLSLYSTTKTSNLEIFLDNFWRYCVLVQVVEYFLELIAFGCYPSKRRELIIEGVVVAYSFIYFSFFKSGNVDEEATRYLGSIFIICQIYRYINLLNEIQVVNKMLNSLFTIFPKTFNIFLLVASVLYIYAIIGMQLFAFLRPNQQLNLWSQNYKTFGMALFSLVKFSIMESPISQINDASQSLSPNFVCFQINSYQDYDKYGDFGCGSRISSYLFFLTFHIVYSLFLMSTFLAFVADSYDEVRRSEQCHVSKHFLQKILEIWMDKDPEATGFMDYRQFWIFTKKIMDLFDKNLKKKKKSSKLCSQKILIEKQKFLQRLDVNIYSNEQGYCFQFHQTIQGLAKIYIQKLRNTKIHEKKIKSFFEDHNIQNSERKKKTGYRSSQIYSLILLKSGLKIWKKKIEKNMISLSLGTILLKTQE